MRPLKSKSERSTWRCRKNHLRLRGGLLISWFYSMVFCIIWSISGIHGISWNLLPVSWGTLTYFAPIISSSSREESGALGKCIPITLRRERCRIWGNMGWMWKNIKKCYKSSSTWSSGSLFFQRAPHTFIRHWTGHLNY